MTSAAWPVRWRGSWIWDRRPEWRSLADTGLDAAAADAFVFFRRSFRLDAVPAEVPFRITADGRYALWVNGQELARGPIRSQAGVLYYDDVDVAPALARGYNAVAVLVRHYGAPTPWWSPAPAFSELGRGGLVADCAVLPELSSGSSWRTWRAPWRSHRPPFFGAPAEEVDGRVMSDDWREVAFDDSRWDVAVELASHGGWGEPEAGPLHPPAAPFTLLPRPLPQLTDIERVARPAGGTMEPVPVGAGEVEVFDFGEMTLGLAAVSLDAPDGARVVLQSGDTLRDGRPADPYRRWEHTHVCADGANEVEPFESVGMRYLSVAADAPVTVRRVAVRERRYPLGSEGAFECDDAELNATWRMGVRTLQLCSSDSFLDCPGREQRAWLSDAYLDGLLTYVSGSDPRLALHALDLGAQATRPDGLLAMVAAGDLAASPVTIPDCSLYWVFSLCRAWDYTGAAIVERLLPRAQAILDWFWNFVEAGVLQEVPGWVFVDWWPVRARGPLATLHGLYLLALRDHARLADALDQPRVAGLSRERADALQPGFAQFIDTAGGRVLESPRAGIATQHALAMATHSGALEPGEASAMLERALAPEVACYPQSALRLVIDWELPHGFDPARHVLATQPFFAHWVHQALAHVGRHDLLLESIRRWRQFLGTGDGTTWEFWVDGGDAGSHCHAWSATPTYDLTTHILGVSPAGAGFERVRVQPWFGPLRHLAGTVPTPRGPVHIDLDRGGDGPRGRVELPPGTSGDLEFAEWPELGRVELRGGANPVVAGRDSTRAAPGAVKR